MPLINLHNLRIIANVMRGECLTLGCPFPYVRIFYSWLFQEMLFEESWTYEVIKRTNVTPERIRFRIWEISLFLTFFQSSGVALIRNFQRGFFCERVAMFGRMF